MAARMQLFFTTSIGGEIGRHFGKAPKKVSNASSRESGSTSQLDRRYVKILRMVPVEKTHNFYLFCFVF
jgi:hypothetical protein